MWGLSLGHGRSLISYRVHDNRFLSGMSLIFFFFTSTLVDAASPDLEIDSSAIIMAVYKDSVQDAEYTVVLHYHTTGSSLEVQKAKD